MLKIRKPNIDISTVARHIANRWCSDGVRVMQRMYNETFLISAIALQDALIDNSCGCGLFLPEREIMRFNVKCFSSHNYVLVSVLPTLFSLFGIREPVYHRISPQECLWLRLAPFINMIYDQTGKQCFEMRNVDLGGRKSSFSAPDRFEGEIKE